MGTTPTDPSRSPRSCRAQSHSAVPNICHTANTRRSETQFSASGRVGSRVRDSAAYMTSMNSAAMALRISTSSPCAAEERMSLAAAAAQRSSAVTRVEISAAASPGKSCSRAISGPTLRPSAAS